MKGLNDPIGVVGANKEWEKFFIEWRPNNKVAFRQQVSNLYLGRTDNTNESLGLAQNCGNNELF